MNARRRHLEEFRETETAFRVLGPRVVRNVKRVNDLKGGKDASETPRQAIRSRKQSLSISRPSRNPSKVAVRAESVAVFRAAWVYFASTAYFAERMRSDREQGSRFTLAHLSPIMSPKMLHKCR